MIQQRNEQRQIDRNNNHPSHLSQAQKKLRQQKEKQKHEQNLQIFKKQLSISSIFAIPFIALNFYDKVYMIVMMPITIILLLYKNLKYPLPGYAIATQSIIIACIILTQWIRYHLSRKSILQKNPTQVIQYIIVTFFLVPSYVFLLRLQTYVLFIDWIMNWIAIGFLALQFIVAIWIFIVFRSKKKNS